MKIEVTGLISPRVRVVSLMSLGVLGVLAIMSLKVPTLACPRPIGFRALLPTQKGQWTLSAAKNSFMEPIGALL